MKQTVPNGPTILSDYIATNVKTNIISSGGTLPPTVSLTNYQTLRVNNINVQDIVMSDGIVSGVASINNIIIESHVSRHILGGQDEIPISFSTPSEISVLSNPGISNDVPKADHVHAHGNQVGGSLHANATSSSNGFMSSSDKIILDQIGPSNSDPRPLGDSYIGTSNAYSRPDHVHTHGNQGGGTLHSLATNLSNGFMSSNDKIKINNFSWSPAQNTLTLTQGSMSIGSQPFGYLSSSGISKIIISGVQTPLYDYYTSQNNLTNIGISNGRFVVIYPGIYSINAILTTLQTLQGSVFGYICVNNVETLGTDFYSFTPSSDTGTINMSAMVKLSAQDIVYITVFQNTGSDMNISSVGITNKFTIKLLYGNGPAGSSVPRWNQAYRPNSVGALAGIPVAISQNGQFIVIGRPGFGSGGFTKGAINIFQLISGVWTTVVNGLIGSGITSNARMGWSVAISSDGTTIAAGAPYINNTFGTGAVFIFQFNGSTWVQQGSKLFVNNPLYIRTGSSVSLSSDGNTLVVGDPEQSSTLGTALIFIRSGVTWSQQATIFGTGGTIGAKNEGFSVALSSNGNTSAFGGPSNNSNVGATWVFTRSGVTWSQETLIIVPDNIGTSVQGISVSLSSDGNTLAIGGSGDNGGVGATWIYTRSGVTWTYQAKLIATGSIGLSGQGRSVYLSSDGNTLAIGGNTDNANVGAAWVFTRSGSTWTQQYKMVGSEPTFPSTVYKQGGNITLDGSGSILATGSVPSTAGDSQRFFFIFDKN